MIEGGCLNPPSPLLIFFGLKNIFIPGAKPLRHLLAWQKSALTQLFLTLLLVFPFLHHDGPGTPIPMRP